MASNRELLTDISSFIRVYKDGRVERLVGSPIVQPSLNDPTTGVASKDIMISTTVSARLYLPKIPTDTIQKLPILIYFHGGAFCLESAFSSIHHTYLNFLASQTNTLAVSVEFRLAPEHPLPAAYEDSWAAIQWVASQNVLNNNNSEPWLRKFGDFAKVYIAGDTCGGNIVHNMGMRAGVEELCGDVKILGGVIMNPYFLGSEPVGSDAKEGHDQGLIYRIWSLVYPSAPGGFDNVMINPFAHDAPSLSGLGYCKLVVVVAEKDVGRDRSVMYYERVKESGWRGEVELIYVEGEGHSFHVIDPQCDNARSLTTRLAAFMK